MTTNLVTFQIPYFPDPNKGKPISGGFLYAGVPNQDPIVESNRVQLYIRDGETTDNFLAITQPVPLSAGGVPEYQGRAVELYLGQDYSLKITDKNGSQEYYDGYVSITSPTGGSLQLDTLEGTTQRSLKGFVGVFGAELSALYHVDGFVYEGDGGVATWKCVSITTTTGSAGFNSSGQYQVDLDGTNFAVFEPVAEANTVHSSIYGNDQVAVEHAINFVQSLSAGGEVMISNSMELSTRMSDPSVWVRNMTITVPVGVVVTSPLNDSIIKGTLSTPLDIVINIQGQAKGQWDTTPGQMSGDNWLFQIDGCRTWVVIGGGLLTDSRRGGTKCDVYAKSEYIGTTFERMVRGSLHHSAFGSIKALGVSSEDSTDDWLSAHVTTDTTEANLISQHSIAGGITKFTQAATSLGAKNLTMSGHNGRDIRGKYINIGIDTAFSQGYSPVLNIAVSACACQDLWNTNAYEPSTNFGRYISFGSYRPLAGSGEATAPGFNDAATGTVRTVYGNMQGIGATASMSQGFNISFTSIDLLKSRQGGVQVDNVFNFDGYENITPTEGDLRCEGFYLRDNISNWVVAENNVQVGDRAVFALFDGTTYSGYFNGRIGNNILQESINSDLISTNAAASDSIFDVNITGNTFDGDPYFLSSSRSEAAGAYSGKWDDTANTRAMNLNNLSNASVGNNKYKNVSAPINTGAGAKFTSRGGNVLHGFFVAAGDNANNEGIRNALRPSVINMHQFVVSDPSDANYGEQLSSTSITSGLTSDPNSGYHMEGLFVDCIAPQTRDGNQMIIQGWSYRTTGDTHVLTTDFYRVYGSTVTPAT